MRPSRDPDLISAFAAAIKARRLELGLTQEDLAGRIEIDRPFITLMESATKQPSISVLWRKRGLKALLSGVVQMSRIA